ncbi:MAG: glycosyltransferase [Actinobacteria bacterium]|nr:glycosyltransferase [Actinomycetota bacterium]
MTEPAPDNQAGFTTPPAANAESGGQIEVVPAHPEVSVIIPLFNGADTIGLVLEALYESTSRNFEVIIINDRSTDNSLQVLKELTKKYPFRLIDFPENRGVSKARNAGAAAARGEIILFIDADCIVLPDTIERSVKALRKGDSICVGGAYTREPWDKDFFSIFQSLYIHHVETKIEHPDYIATHCMAIWKETYDEFGGFKEDYFIGHAASVEDVELSHRLIKAGYQLSMPRDIQVQHMFRFSLKKSVKNAVKKSKYWTMYSLHNRDVTKDSGAASYELKVNVGTQVINLVLVVIAIATSSWYPLVGAAFLYGINTAMSYNLLRLIQKEKGWMFLLKAMAYYQLVYPYIVAYGSFMGIMKYLWEVKLTRRYQ